MLIREMIAHGACSNATASRSKDVFESVGIILESFATVSSSAFCDESGEMGRPLHPIEATTNRRGFVISAIRVRCFPSRLRAFGAALLASCRGGGFARGAEW